MSSSSASASADSKVFFGLSACCFTPGHLLPVSPKGVVSSIEGIETYRTGESKEKAVVYATDIFGLKLENSKLISDTIAAGGFHVVIPNILNDAMDPNNFSRDPNWRIRNPPENAADILDKVVNHLHSEGFKSISVIGFCYGAKPAYLLQLRNSHIKTAVYSHPSMLQLGEGEKLPKGSHLLINCAETDQAYFGDLQNDFEQGALKSGVKLQVIYYPATKHGFAARFTDDDKVKAQRDLEAATINTLKFLQLYA